MSGDGVASWEVWNEGLGNLWVKALALDISSCDVLYAGTNDGVWERAVWSDLTPGVCSQTDSDPLPEYRMRPLHVTWIWCVARMPTRESCCGRFTPLWSVGMTFGHKQSNCTIGHGAEDRERFHYRNPPVVGDSRQFSGQKCSCA